MLQFGTILPVLVDLFDLLLDIQIVDFELLLQEGDSLAEITNSSVLVGDGGSQRLFLLVDPLDLLLQVIDAA